MTLALLDKSNVLGVLDLSNLTDGELYKSLFELRKDKYDIRDKIVIHYFQDLFKFQNTPGAQLSKFVEYIKQIDIPQFFITVVTSNKKFEQEFQQLSDEPIDFVLVEQEFLRKIPEPTDTFCILPWMHLYIGPDSNIMPCCMSDKEFPLGSINVDSIRKIINNDNAKTIRKNMLSGIRSKECSQCYLAESVNIQSYRQTSNKEWHHLKSLVDSTLPDGTIEFSPKYLDIRLNNICNLKCRYCSGHYSSAIAQEEVELFGTGYQTLTTAQKRQALENICNQYISSVEKIYFAGGEPLIMSEHYQILDKLIECGNTNVEIIYNTNFTNLSFKHKSVLDLWTKFSNITVGASIDAFREKLEYARHGTKWNIIENNLNLVREKCPNVKFTVTSTAGLLTVESLIDLQVHWHTNNQVPLENFAVSLMYTPEMHSLQVLPLHHKDRIAKLINQHILQCKGADKLIANWKSVIEFMYAKDVSYLLPEFNRITKLQDAHRKESFLTTYPQFADLYN